MCCLVQWASFCISFLTAFALSLCVSLSLPLLDLVSSLILDSLRSLCVTFSISSISLHLSFLTASALCLSLSKMIICSWFKDYVQVWCLRHCYCITEVLCTCTLRWWFWRPFPVFRFPFQLSCFIVSTCLVCIAHSRIEHVFIAHPRWLYTFLKCDNRLHKAIHSYMPLCTISSYSTVTSLLLCLDCAILCVLCIHWCYSTKASSILLHFNLTELSQL